ncbi:hypothetical protein GBF38_004804 [Nibea albiflora]|uniref:Uncharacterized protein n=1 Tax=Nibea albiflora TaxID=240163 RepID=A0ACB7EGM7_NIBAL|nr:hypothetical protein GBF38_004804 [Nibea albiflora]
MSVRTGQDRDPANSNQLTMAVRSQEARLMEQEEHLTALTRGVHGLANSQESHDHGDEGISPADQAGPPSFTA